MSGGGGSGGRRDLGSGSAGEGIGDLWLGLLLTLGRNLAAARK